MLPAASEVYLINVHLVALSLLQRIIIECAYSIRYNYQYQTRSLGCNIIIWPWSNCDITNRSFVALQRNPRSLQYEQGRDITRVATVTICDPICENPT